MKKVMYLMFLILFCLHNMESFGQVSIVDNGVLPTLVVHEAGKSPYPPVVVFWDCRFNASARLNVANWLGVVNTGDGSENSSSADAVPLFLRVTVERLDIPVPVSISEIFPFTEWEYIGDYGDNNEPVHKSIMDISMDASDICDDGVNSNNVVEITYELLTVTQDLGTYVLFPMCSQNESGQLFSCEVFEPIPCDKALTGPCVSSDYNTFTKWREGACYCTEFHDPGNNSSGRKDLANEDSDINLFQPTASPNPFRDQLEINWSGNQQKQMEVFLYNSTGKVVKTFYLYDIAGSRSLNTMNLPTGVYFLVSNNGGEREVVKLIKQ